MIDAHCHLNSTRLDASADTLVGEARASGIDGIVMAGVDSDCWSTQLVIARRHPGFVFPVFGLHPQCVPDLDDRAIAAELAHLEHLLDAHRPVAIGETGLDLMTPIRKAAIDKQRQAFAAHVELAKRFDLPLVLHLLKADNESLHLLKHCGLPQRGAVVHSFSGSPEFAKALVSLGLHISFCGTLTLPQSRRLREAALVIPRDRLLIETDSPDQTPFGARPVADTDRPRPFIPNRPANLHHIAAALAEARGESVDIIAFATTSNTRRFFALPDSPCR